MIVVIVNALFPVEPAGPIGQAGVKSIEMIGGSNDKQAIVPFEPIKLVEEKRSVLISDQTVEVLQYQLHNVSAYLQVIPSNTYHTRGQLTCFEEDALHAYLFALETLNFRVSFLRSFRFSFSFYSPLKDLT